MAVIILPTSLRDRVQGTDRIHLEGATVGECLARLERKHSGLDGWILDDRGLIRRHVNVFVGGTTATLEQAVADDDEIYVIQAISGG